MNNLVIEGSEATPEINFDYASGVLHISGESYPENTAQFYAPVFKWVTEYLERDDDKAMTLNMEVVYFNSSSSKAFMNLLDLLAESADLGRKVVVNWIYDVKNESGQEYGEEFKEELQSLEFNLVVKNV